MGPVIVKVLGIFVLGAFYEGLWMLFFHYLQQKHKLKTILSTMTLGYLQYAGLLNSFGHWYMGIALVLGYGFGTWIAMILQDKL